MEMRNLILLMCCFFVLPFCTSAQTMENKDESLGLPGDNLNLYAVMNLFQESKTLEQFEKDLNDENSKINNLDLNGDGKIDYISVIDNVEGNAHTIVLQDAINEKENQDVAVFYVNTDANNQVQIQLIGDESLYGKDYIIEPNSGGNAQTVQRPNPGYTGNANVGQEEPVVVESRNWPIVRLLFEPSYIAWHSPWYYGYYPQYWHPWLPLFWHSYYGYHSHMNEYYQRNFLHSSHYIDPRFHERYYARGRKIAPTVVRHREEGLYKKTYSHPELRKEGSDRFERLHSGNSNRPANRAAVMPRNTNPSSREVGSRSVNNRGNNRPTTNLRTTNNIRPTVTQGNSNVNRPSNNRGTTQPSNNRATIQPSNVKGTTQPSNNRATTQPSNNRATAQPSNNRAAAQPSNVKGTVQQPNVTGVVGSAAKSPVTKKADVKPAAKPKKVAPKKEEEKPAK
jgi:hypothetical protein